jgi:MFS family permease
MEAAGVGSPLLTASILYIINVVLTLPAMLYLDKWGRRPTMLVGSCLMILWLSVSGGVQGTYGQPNPFTDPNLKDISWVIQDNDSASMALILSTYFFVASFAVTWGPTSWTYPAEIFPSKVRARAVSLATGTNWACNCALAFAVPPLLWHINWRTNMIFVAFNSCAFLHMFLAAPETKGKLLEEMEEVFDTGRPAWRKPNVESRVDRLQHDIELGNVHLSPPMPGHTASTEILIEPAPQAHLAPAKRVESSLADRNDSVAHVEDTQSV